MTTGSFTDIQKDKTPTLMARDYKAPTLVAKATDELSQGDTDYTVRRLTPTECARLQGFPDWWCSDLGTEKPTDAEVYEWYKIFETYEHDTLREMRSELQTARFSRHRFLGVFKLYKIRQNGLSRLSYP